jgi:hypothetical protein
MAVAVAQAVRVVPIADGDVQRVGEFLYANLNAGVPADVWARALLVPWAVERPNAGFMLLADEDVVGVHLAFYSERTIDGRPERFCNLAAWCVLPEYRFYSVRLLKALLAQEGYHFTDLSPSGNVVALNERLKFRTLDTTSALIPNLPWPSWPGRTVIGSDPALIERSLAGRELEIYRDHAATGAARHVVLVRGGECCYVIFRKDRRKGLPLFASVLHVSNPELLRRLQRPFARHLLLRHGVAATLAEERIVGHRPRVSFRLRSSRPKMFKSAQLEPAQIDYLYSELVCVPW